MRFRCGFTFLAPGPFPYDTLPLKDKVAICITEEFGRVAWLSCSGYPLSGFASAGSRHHTAGRKAALMRVEPNPVLPVAVPEFCAVSSAASSLERGLKPAAVAKFKLLFPAAREFALCSEAPREEGEGRRAGQPLIQPAPALFSCGGQCLLPERGW